MLDRGAPKGSAYSAQPIEIGQPVWRADLLESVEGPPGSFDRTHHHPAFAGWEPGRRVYVAGMSDDPLGWLGALLPAGRPGVDEVQVADDDANPL